MKLSLNEQLMEALAYDSHFKFPQKELVPRWAVACVRDNVRQSYTPDTNPDEIFQNSLDAKDYIQKVYMKSLDTVTHLEGIAYSLHCYSAVLREQTLHIFKEHKILERNGDVMVEDLDSLDRLLSLTFHKEWKADSASLYTGFTFEWKLLHEFTEPLVVRGYGD